MVCRGSVGDALLDGFKRRWFEMIKCPVCGSMCFDDMEICFGCMHRFEDALSTEDETMASGLPHSSGQTCEAETAVPRAGQSRSRNQSAPVPSWLSESGIPLPREGERLSGADGAYCRLPFDGCAYELVMRIRPVETSCGYRRARSADEVSLDEVVVESRR